jgi:hypothetical protein
VVFKRIAEKPSQGYELVKAGETLTRGAVFLLSRRHAAPSAKRPEPG